MARMGKRVIVVGAGPIGVCAALGAAACGHEVMLYEAGEVGDALRRWGPTRLFTPLGMNVHSAFFPRLRLDGDALYTGPELAERVLVPLAESLGERVRTRHRVRSIARARLARGELVGHPVRAERPFRLLVEGPDGEFAVEAERVLDASGVYGQPIGLGVPGERAAAPLILRTLGELAERRSALLGRRVLLLGQGHSAAHALAWLEGARVTWAVRAPNARPCQEVAGDPLPERQNVVSRANQLAERPPAWLKVERRAALESLDPGPDGALAARLSGGRFVTADVVVALIGYRPDLSMVSELALEISPRTEGAARLDRALAGVTDCLSVPQVHAADLASGEPGFHLVGSKSYGRARTFLLQTGYAQLDTLLDAL
jgi:thioredoxin reductase